MREKVARLGEVLRQYAGEVIPGSSGYGICCPFHVDHSPSSTVFYDTGIFFCFSGCGKKPLAAGLRKLRVPEEIIRELTEKDPEEEKPKLSPLLAAEWGPPAEEALGTVGIVSEDPWQEGWGYRGIRTETLTSPTSFIHKQFKPSLVRLWVGSRGKIHQERYSRLCLHYGKHEIFLRLSSEQEVKTYNSSGLSLKDPKLPPFGLGSFKLRKDQAGIILVEGAYDLMRMVQNLEDLGVGDAFTVLALLGVSHWESFLKKLELRLLPQLGDTPIILAFDNDKAGYSLRDQALIECRTKLMLPKAQLKVLPYTAHDPGDTSKEETKKALLKLGY